MNRKKGDLAKLQAILQWIRESLSVVLVFAKNMVVLDYKEFLKICEGCIQILICFSERSSLFKKRGVHFEALFAAMK